MPFINNQVIEQLIVPFFALFFFVWGIIGVAVGLSLWVYGGKMLRLFSTMNRWVSTRRGLKVMALPHDIGQTVQKYRRGLAAVIVAGAAYSLFILIARFDVTAVVSALGLSMQRSYIEWAVESLRWLLIVGSVFAIVVGIMLGFFPNNLGALEAYTNQWYSFRRLGMRLGLPGDTMYLTIDKWVETFPRTAGWIIAISALFVAVESGIALFGRH